MDELEIKGKKYISSRRAAELTGYAKDYIGQLVRAGKVPGTRVGRSWYVDEGAILSFGKSTKEKSVAESYGSSASLAPARTPVERTIVSPIQLRRSVISPATLQVPGYVLPGTWSAVTYFSDDAALMPIFTGTQQNKTVQSHISEGSTKVRIKIMDAPAQRSIAPAQIVNKAQEIRRKKDAEKWSGFALPLGALAAALGIFVFLPGLFSPHAFIVQDNGQYSANVIRGLEYVWNTLMQCPPFVQGLLALESFLSILRDSSINFFHEGFQFINWLFSLV